MWKKVIIGVVVILGLLLIAEGAFWLGHRKENFDKKFEPTKNYKIKELSGGKIVENKKAGLSFKVPRDWNVEIFGPEGGEITVEIDSPEVEFYPETRLPQKGCGVAVSVEYDFSGYKNLVIRDQIQKIQENSTSEENKNKEVITVSSKPAIKRLIFDSPTKGKGFQIEVPLGEDKLYNFYTFFPLSDEEKCQLEFNKFLEGVSIK